MKVYFRGFVISNGTKDYKTGDGCFAVTSMIKALAQKAGQWQGGSGAVAGRLLAAVLRRDIESVAPSSRDYCFAVVGTEQGAQGTEGIFSWLRDVAPAHINASTQLGKLGGVGAALVAARVLPLQRR